MKMYYNNLNRNEKLIFDAIEDIFNRHNVGAATFGRILSLLAAKYSNIPAKQYNTKKISFSESIKSHKLDSFCLHASKKEVQTDDLPHDNSKEEELAP
jgi:hypothetical protein